MADYIKAEVALQSLREALHDMKLPPRDSRGSASVLGLVSKQLWVIDRYIGVHGSTVAAILGVLSPHTPLYEVFCGESCTQEFQYGWAIDCGIYFTLQDDGCLLCGAFTDPMNEDAARAARSLAEDDLDELLDVIAPRG